MRPPEDAVAVEGRLTRFLIPSSVGKFFPAFVVGAIAGGGALWGWHTSQLPTTCGGVCGEGTECVHGRCEVRAEVVEVDDPPPKKKSKKKRRRRKRSGEKSDGASTKDARVNDSHVPRFNAKKTKTIGEETGSERLSDAAINRELAKLDGKFQACIAAAADASEAELSSGRIAYEFGIAPSGKVTGVNVRAPAQLKTLGVPSCVRVAVYGHKFPRFDGLEMGARSSFSI